MRVPSDLSKTNYLPMKQIIECVPNFSEGRDTKILDAIADAIRSVDGVKLLEVDPGKATNRTVFTFVGEPAQVCEAAFRAIAKSYELIDMAKHQGEHPRMGATDVCPLIPISGITMEETAQWAHQLGKRVGEELGLSGYFYEAAALTPARKNLADIRAGEYEGLKDKILQPAWKPDFGPAVFNPKFGAVVIGARNFLVAYNVNLNTTSTRRANAIAFDVRERGRVKRIGDPVTGEIVKDADGNSVHIPGMLKSVKAIGWFIEEYGIAQISMNLTDISICKVHEAYEAVKLKAEERGVRVTGSELVGLIPLQALIDAGKYYLTKQKRSLGVSEAEIIKIAVKSLGLDELKPFDPQKKIIEYVMNEDSGPKLVKLTAEAFADETASESPAPGGGSVSAYVGALGISLGTMVANLSSHKRGWDEKWEYYSQFAEKGQELKKTLLHLTDEDTAAFNKIMNAFQLPNGTEVEKLARKNAIQEATKYAIEVPYKVMETAYQSLEVIKAMAETGMKSSISDIGVGALCARTAVMGAFLNVKINASGLQDEDFKKRFLANGSELVSKANALVDEILKIVENKISV
jgi:glutamate formiminotransferase/formiminotetrahydrofolate cyclodeaminase